MKGYSKIEKSCEKAAQDGWQYVWIDTCCIDKESSSELSEAINSMYSWYQNSQVCYVYLVDVPSNEDPEIDGSSFSRSRWFSRGWTLQELIAPSSLIFYGGDWEEIGTKASLQDIISLVTGIDTGILLANHSGEISVAKRMSWASTRQTTREEDIAYCLMGLFGVNMPTIYGEGRNAFIRLQQEIMKFSDDHTIFAWTANEGGQRGLLAHSPAEFDHSSGVVRSNEGSRQTPYSITNQGLHIELPLVPVKEEQGVFLAGLNCHFAHDDQNIAVYLKKENGNQYVRTKPYSLAQVKPGHIKPSTVFVPERDPSKLDVSHWMRPQRQYMYSVKTILPLEHGFNISETHPDDLWVKKGKEKFLKMSGSGTSGIILFRRVTTGEEFAVMLGIHNYSVWSAVVTSFGNETAKDIRDSYYREGGRGGTLWKNLDRSSADLEGGKMVTVSIRKKMTSEGIQFHAEIAVKSKASLLPTQWVRPNALYVFSVVIAPPNHGFIVSEALPEASWDNQNGARFLTMPHSGTSGILMFRNAASGEKFAVMLGVHNYDIWTDIVINFGHETAQDIRDSYYRDGGRGAILWLKRKSFSVRLTGGRSVYVTSRIRKSHDGQVDFLTDIKVG